MAVHGCVGLHLGLMAVRIFFVKLLCSEFGLEDNSSRLLSKFDFCFVVGFEKKANIDNTESYLTLIKKSLPIFMTKSAV